MTATYTLEEKKNQHKAGSFPRLNFNVFIDVDDRHGLTLEEKYEIFIAVVWKWEVLATSKVKLSGSAKKSNRKTGKNIRHFFHKRVLNQEVSCFSCATTKGDKCTKKCAAQLDLSRYRCRWELHYCILFFEGVTYKYINESFAFSPGCMGKELLMHLVNKNEDFQGPLMS